MKNIFNYKKQDIVLFPFPFTDLTTKKIRPCLVLSNEMSNDLILCQITSKKVRCDDYSVELKSDETLKGTLDIDSFIRANMLFTADKNLILKKVCELSDLKYKKVIEKIIQLIK